MPVDMFFTAGDILKWMYVISDIYTKEKIR